LLEIAGAFFIPHLYWLSQHLLTKVTG